MSLYLEYSLDCKLSFYYLLMFFEVTSYQSDDLLLFSTSVILFAGQDLVSTDEEFHLDFPWDFAF